MVRRLGAPRAGARAEHGRAGAVAASGGRVHRVRPAAADLSAPIAVLTYQALCQLDDPEALATSRAARRRRARGRRPAGADAGRNARARVGPARPRRGAAHEPSRIRRRGWMREVARAEHGTLHLGDLLAEGARAVDALRAAGACTLVLDECHHLIAVGLPGARGRRGAAATSPRRADRDPPARWPAQSQLYATSSAGPTSKSRPRRSSEGTWRRSRSSPGPGRCRRGRLVAEHDSASSGSCCAARRPRRAATSPTWVPRVRAARGGRGPTARPRLDGLRSATSPRWPRRRAVAAADGLPCRTGAPRRAPPPAADARRLARPAGRLRAALPARQSPAREAAARSRRSRPRCALGYTLTGADPARARGRRPRAHGLRGKALAPAEVARLRGRGARRPAARAGALRLRARRRRGPTAALAGVLAAGAGTARGRARAGRRRAHRQRRPLLVTGRGLRCAPDAPGAGGARRPPCGARPDLAGWTLGAGRGRPGAARRRRRGLAPAPVGRAARPLLAPAGRAAWSAPGRCSARAGTRPA